MNRWMVVGLVVCVAWTSMGFAQSQPQPSPEKARQIDLEQAGKIVRSVPIAEWLGPLAPVALSPFFGIACLSGLSLYGPAWIPKDNFLLGDQSLLKNETLFFVFLGLTILTSLPRLTKVSKPLAQLGDQLEAYAGMVTMLAVKFFLAPAEATPDVALVELGVWSASVDMALMIAGAVNMLVINCIKFFCELAVWLIPVPFIDACFEAANKTLCGALVMLYAINPWLAMLVNLSLFVVCLLLLRWFGRSLKYFRTLLLDPLYAALWPRYGEPTAEGVEVFVEQAFGPLSARSRVRLSKHDGGWVLRHRTGLLQTTEIPLGETVKHLEIRPGWIGNSITPTDGSGPTLTMSRRYQRQLPQVAAMLGAVVAS